MPLNRKPYDEEEEDDDGILGKCKNCIHFEANPSEDVSDESIAPCLHPDFEEYELRVSGDSSCNLFEAAEDEEDDEDEEEAEEDDEESY
jgi:hypothetical protein